MKKKLIFKILSLSLLPLFSMHLHSQGTNKISPYVQLQYFKNTDDQRILQASLTFSRNRMELPIPGMEISFFSGKDKKELITTALTDANGIAKINLGADARLSIDKDGTWIFGSVFKGNDTIDAGTSEISIKDVKLDMILSQVDSIKTITVHAFVKEGGKDKPVSGEVVTVYVPRMFSLLPIVELTLDEQGTATGEFPSDLPGDKEGNVIIIAKFLENPAFGNVEKRETLKWGLPTEYVGPTSHRALWTKVAPRWMIYTLTVLLIGVWGHYLFAIISLIRIKIDANRKAKEEYRI